MLIRGRKRGVAWHARKRGVAPPSRYICEYTLLRGVALVIQTTTSRGVARDAHQKGVAPRGRNTYTCILYTCIIYTWFIQLKTIQIEIISILYFPQIICFAICQPFPRGAVDTVTSSNGHHCGSAWNWVQPTFYSFKIKQALVPPLNFELRGGPRHFSLSSVKSPSIFLTKNKKIFV